jgi:hypothetical protein
MFLVCSILCYYVQLVTLNIPTLRNKKRGGNPNVAFGLGQRKYYFRSTVTSCSGANVFDCWIGKTSEVDMAAFNLLRLEYCWKLGQILDYGRVLPSSGMLNFNVLTLKMGHPELWQIL